MRRILAAVLLAAAWLGGAAGTVTAAQAQPTASEAVTREFLLGRWTDTGNCAEYVDFLADGRFTLPDGQGGRWTLEGDRLSFIGNGTATARVHAESRDRIVLTHGNGTTGNSTRCATTAPSARRPMPALPASVQAALAMSRPLDRAFLFGRWTDDGDCSNVIDFQRSGRFVVPATGARGQWRLQGENLSFIAERTVTARARRVGRDRILLIHGDGSLGQSIRC